MGRTRWFESPGQDVEKVGEYLRDVSTPLTNRRELDPLVDRIGDARYVLLGEASHGTAEYYDWRAEISKRLIQEKGFSFLAVEGDWPDCYCVNRYVKGYRECGASARDVLRKFDRWPTWMWANEETLRLAEWLRQHNDKQSSDRKVGFYGLDVYSLWESMHGVLKYLQKGAGPAAAAARKAFQCFEPYGEDVQDYARATFWASDSCEQEVVSMLTQLRKQAHHYPGDREEYFHAEQNALVALNAERYYRTMTRGGAASWNIRDRHMVETLERLMKFHGPQAKAIVWEHNTHIGDARATDMACEGMVNVGQLVREAHDPDDVVLVGFSSYQGSVIAGAEWGAPMERMKVPAAREGSWEQLLHDNVGQDSLLIFNREKSDDAARQQRGHRAIGVVYHPEYEMYGNFVPTVLTERYDALIHIEETQALHPLHVSPHLEKVPETYPTGV